MIIRVSNPSLEKNERTYLSADAAAADTSLTVQNNEGISANDYLVVGNLGIEQTELVQVSSVSGNTTIVTGALKFNHGIDTPLSFIRYNQYQVWRATSKTGTYSQVGSNTNIEVDQTFSEFEDTGGTSTSWYKIRFYNSTSNTYSDYSDPVQGSGYTDDSVKALMDRIYTIGNDPDRKVIGESEMLTILNDAYRIAIAKTMKADRTFYLKRGYVDVVDSYDTGTVSVSDSGTTVTGVGTTWTSAMVGRKIRFYNEGYAYTIATVTPSTSLTLTESYNGNGSNLSGSAYTIFQDEFDLYDSTDLTVVTNARYIDQVVDEDGNIVRPYDPNRTETGYYLKRVGDSVKFCLNYVSGTNNVGGRWTVLYVYQPDRLDSMGDIPELPPGFDGVLQSYGIARLKERMGESPANFQNQFQSDLNNMVRRGTSRASKSRAFYLVDRVRSGRTGSTDSDWLDQVYGR